MNELAVKLRELRTTKNLTLEEVGNAVGVSKSTVLKWENGKIQNMRRDKISALAAILGTTPAFLLGWVDEPESPILNAQGIAAMQKITRKKVFENLLSLTDFQVIADESEGMIIINTGKAEIEQNDEMIERIMDDIIDYFAYRLVKEGKR